MCDNCDKQKACPQCRARMERYKVLVSEDGGKEQAKIEFHKMLDDAEGVLLMTTTQCGDHHTALGAVVGMSPPETLASLMEAVVKTISECPEKNREMLRHMLALKLMIGAEPDTANPDASMAASLDDMLKSAGLTVPSDQDKN